MLGPYQLNTIVTGDARELAKAVPDASVDLVFCDPVYEQTEDYEWLAQLAMRVLVPGGNLVAFCGNLQSPGILNRVLGAGLEWCDWLIFRETARRRKRWDKDIIGLYEMAIWVNKPGETRLGRFVKNFSFVSNGYVKTDKWHDWQKEIGGVAHWIDRLSTGVVFDPFTGGGTVPAVCKMLHRNYLAFEIDEATAQSARERVRNTQPPLPLKTAKQLELLS